MMLGKIFSGIIILFLFFGLVLIYLRYIERQTLFHPAKEIEFSPNELGLSFEDIFFKTPDGFKLNGWFIPSKDAKHTILFCHGNAGNISHRLQKMNFFHQLGCNIFIFDYRGYGRSVGSPYEGGLYLDAKAAYDYLLSRSIAPRQIIGYGESLGGAVIIDLASKHKALALIVESSFSSAKDMASCVYPFIPYGVFASRFDSLNKIKTVTIPKLIIHSLNDEIVPYGLARKLYTSAASPKEFLQISGPHNSCFYDSEKLLKERIAGFLNRL
ncbi:MAG: alpha/beta hydrolase [Candidatus Omnitrophica bacterium]|nr:alpha/beta hydrolase [Candidatus Omnitrophota bacterium]